MKRVNFWKTLFLSALTVAAFTGCSNDDSDDDGGIPSITVNGAQSTNVAVDLEGGTTEAVTIESSGDWTLTIAGENGADVADCVASLSSGKKGTSTVTFTVDPADAERTYTATVTTVGSIAGQSISLSATIKIMQNAGGSTDVKTNVKEIRNTLTFPSTATEITEDLTLTGIVVSDYEGNNINAKQAMLVDNTTEPGAGITVRFENAYTDDLKMTKGSIVSIKIKGGKSQSYSGLYQVQIESNSPEVTIVDANDNTPEAIEVTDLSKLAEYQSQLVKIYAQPVEDIRGAYYYDASLANNGGYVTRDFQTKTGALVELSFNKYTGTASGDNPWSDKLQIPSNAGYVKGCVSVYSAGSQLTPRNAEDLAGLTDELFTVTAQTGTIGQITTTGDYEISGAKVVGASTQGFVMQDATGVMYVHLGKEATIPALGNTVTVNGTVEEYGSNLQFSYPTVTVTDEGTDYDLPEPTEVTADNIATIADGKPQYVKLTCELAIDKNKGYYNFTFLFSSNYTGSLCYPEASWADPYDKKTIDVEGWYVYTYNSKYFYVVASKIEENASIATGSFTTTPTAFAATDPQPQVLNFTANEAAGTVKFEITGANAEKFTCSDQTASTVTVKAVGNNESDAAYTATLTMKSASGEDLASVNLRQSVAGVQNYVPVTAAPADWSGTYVIGYPNDSKVYILDVKNGDNAATYFKSKTLEEPDFDGTNIIDGDYETVEIAKIAGTEFYSMKYGSEYVGWESGTGNNCQFTTTVPSADTPSYQWKIELTQDNTILMTCQLKDGTTDRTFNYNAGSPRFAVYKTSSSQMKVTFYQLQ